MQRYPQEGTRDRALYDYLVREMVANGGVAPSIRQVIADKVGQDTEMGAMTSTSIVTYHLDALAKMGLVETGGRRGIRLVGAQYIVPVNHEVCRALYHYRLVLVDKALAPIEVPGRVLPLGNSGAEFYLVKLWNSGHMTAQALLEKIADQQFMISETALVTDNPVATQVAIVFGLGVFGSGVFVDG